MHFITVKISKSIQIGDVTIQAKKANGCRKIKLVIDAPGDVRVIRGELEGDLTLQQHLALLTADL